MKCPSKEERTVTLQLYTVELELISTTVSQSTLEARSSSLSPSLTLSPCPVLYTRQDITNSFVGPIWTSP